MSTVADRFPNLVMAAKVVGLLIVVLIVLVAMSILLLGVAIVYIILTGGDPAGAPEMALDALMNNVLVSGAYMVIQNIALVLVAVLFVMGIDGKRPALKALGLGREKSPGLNFLRGVMLNVAFLLSVLAITLITGIISFEKTGFSAYSPSAVAISFIAMAIGTLAVGIGEETVFRGYLQKILADKYGIAAGIVVTSIIFALFHSVTPFARLGPLYLLGVFSLSALLGYLFAITRSLYASIGFHFAQDFLALQVFNFTGEQTLGTYPLLLFSKPGEIVVSGIFMGTWDDLFSILLSLLIIVGLYIYRRNKRDVLKR